MNQSQTIFEACTEAALLAEHRAIETEGSMSPRCEPTTQITFTNDELFAVLDTLRWHYTVLRHSPPWIKAAGLSAMRKVNDAMVRR